MELRCNHCNKIIEEFICDYNADVSSNYKYNEEEGKFELISQELNNDSDTIIYCIECGNALSDELIKELEF